MQSIATFAMGCFWGPEEIFRRRPGVVGTRVGYTGGHTEHPTYEDVCSGTTGHAEAVEVTFDTDITSYENLLDVFWASHDPTAVNRQGPDVGTQYRSAIFYHDETQRAAAEASKAQRASSGTLIATEIVPAGTFYPAEAYHQKYIMKGGGSACHL